MEFKIKKENQPAVPLLLLGLLKGYLKHPLLFMMGSKITFKQFKKTLKTDLPDDFINVVGLQAWLYIRLSKKLDKQVAFEIIRACLLPISYALLQERYCKVDKDRDFRNLIKYHALNHESETGMTRFNTLVLQEESETRYAFKVTRCRFFEFFRDAGVPEMTSIFCSADNAVFNSYQPGKVVFHRNGVGKTIPEGHSYCEFVMENHA